MYLKLNNRTSYCCPIIYVIDFVHLKERIHGSHGIEYTEFLIWFVL